MFQIRFHARAGQGSKSAAQILVEAANTEGKFIQAFPEYGPERMGAPMLAFAKISDTEIREYESVYNPDAVVVIDETLVCDGVVKGAKGVIIINTKKNAAELKKELKYNNIHAIDASEISQKYTGGKGANIVLLGALLKLNKIVKLENAEKIIESHFLKKIGKEKTDGNIKALREGYNLVK